MYGYYYFYFKIMIFYIFYLNMKKDFIFFFDRIFLNICYVLIEYIYYSNGKK